MKLFAAPLQGYTDAVYRHFHAEIYGGADGYFTPFVRIEKHIPRARDMRDATSPLNTNHTLVPQIIFGNTDEFNILCETLVHAGHTCIDLNIGCPFPPQVHRGRGAGVIADRRLLAELAGEMARYPQVTFSAKMRLGVKDPAEWRSVIDIVNELPLCHVTVHPRTASQQYSGSLHTAELVAFEEQSVHPVVINGDIRTPDDIASISGYGVMAGRGLLARPSLFAEYRSGGEMPHDERIRKLHMLHDAMLDHYADVMCGNSQLLSKIRPFWDYLESEIGHRIYKEIHKARTIPAYLAAVRSIR